MPPFKGDTVLGRHRERKLSVSWLSMKETDTIGELGGSGLADAHKKTLLKICWCPGKHP